MKIKDYISITVVAVGIIIGYVIIKSMTTKQNSSNVSSNNNNTNQSSSNSSNSSGTENTSSSGQYNQQEVAKHNTQSDCWVILTTSNQSKVYDVTEYVSNPNKHPGGNVIAPFCGQDITGPFLEGLEGGRVHSSKAESMLSAFAISTLN
jgi:cytochrome b involved in lipid metabolism